MLRQLTGRAAATALLLALCSVPLAAVEAREVLGVAHAAGRYNFTPDDYLDEGADRVLELGGEVIKVFLVPEMVQSFYSFNSDWSPTPLDVVELAQRPYFQSLFAKPFSTYLLVVVPVTGAPQFVDGLSKEEADAERDQMYRLTKYLLSAYAHSGKTFVLQNWEGDHVLRFGLGPGVAPDAVRLQGMADWWNVRQEGVRQARQEVGEDGVEVDHAAEVNFLADAMAGKVTATNGVLPATDCDLYSYSSWDLDFTSRRLVAALDYLATKAPASRRFGHRNIYVGEYGMGKTDGAPEGKRYDRIRQLMEAAIAWGVRYAVYWQVYCNEPLEGFRGAGRPRNRDLRGHWLVRPDGQRAPIWETFVTQLRSSWQRAALETSGELFVTVARRDHALAAALAARDTWQVLTVKDWNGGALESGDTVSLQAHDGLFVSAKGSTGGRVFAKPDLAGGNELFTIRRVDGEGHEAPGRIDPGDGFTLQAFASHRYLGTDASGRGAIRALRTVPTATEVFHYRIPDE
ncbi:MAG TPA: hypothetical protein VGV61_11380 [Thermoanaerobaculia bacterium]|jgi:hypothetical protein|nr:hypothetical protein [Thermoanaerobaculia bacterium]